MKKLAAALALVGFAAASHAATVAWSFAGTSTDLISGTEIPFTAWIAIDTENIGSGPFGPNSGVNGSRFTFAATGTGIGGGSCASGAQTQEFFTTSDNGFTMSSSDVWNSCGLTVEVSGLGIGREVEFDDDPLARWYDLTVEGTIIKITTSGGYTAENIVIEAARQSIPEPGSIALLCAGLLGMIGLGRRKGR